MLSNIMLIISLNSNQEPHGILGDVGRGKTLAPFLNALSHYNVLLIPKVCPTPGMSELKMELK